MEGGDEREALEDGVVLVSDLSALLDGVLLCPGALSDAVFYGVGLDSVRCDLLVGGIRLEGYLGQSVG
jgi:hypothetical protein